MRSMGNPKLSLNGVPFAFSLIYVCLKVPETTTSTISAMGYLCNIRMLSPDEACPGI